MPDWDEVRAAAVASLGMGLWTLDHETGHLECDEEMTALLRGCDTGLLRAWVDQALASRPAGPLARTRVTDNRSDPIRFELPDGESRWIRLGWRTEQKPDGAVVSAGVARDVTEDVWVQRRLREAERLEAIGKISAGVSHNFNNILTIIDACLGELDHTLSTLPNVPDSARRDLDDVFDATRRAADVVASIAKVARLEANVSPCSYDVGSLCERAVELFVHTAPEIEFVVDIDATRTVTATPGALEQVVDNLLANARDALRECDVDAPEVRIAVHDEDAFGVAHVSIEVADNGPGVPDSVVETLFDPFVTTKGSAGTGLGLATVAAIVHQLDGHVVYRNGDSGGAQFRILLPASAGSPRAAEPDAVPLQADTHRILLIDDEQVLVDALARGLRRNGHRVTSANSIEEARIALERTHDIVMLDRSLGHADGRQLVEHIRSSQPNSTLYFFTGEMLSDQDLELVDGVIEKPVSLSDLVARLQRQAVETGRRSPP